MRTGSIFGAGRGGGADPSSSLDSSFKPSQSFDLFESVDGLAVEKISEDLLVEKISGDLSGSRPVRNEVIPPIVERFCAVASADEGAVVGRGKSKSSNLGDFRRNDFSIGFNVRILTELIFYFCLHLYGQLILEVNLD